MTFKRFEDIEAWQLARELCRLVKKMTDKEGFSTDWELKKQIKKSSGSAMDCIAEGFERGSNNEFRYFLGIAKGSCGEVRSQGYRALDYGYITEDERIAADTLAKRCSGAIKKLIEYLNITDLKGQRHIPPPPDNSNLPPSPDDPNFPLRPPPE